MDNRFVCQHANIVLSKLKPDNLCFYGPPLSAVWFAFFFPFLLAICFGDVPVFFVLSPKLQRTPMPVLKNLSRSQCRARALPVRHPFVGLDARNCVLRFGASSQQGM